MEAELLKVYCDTDTLFHNIARHVNDPKTQRELDSLEHLLEKHGDGSITMFRSRVNLRELEATSNIVQRDRLRGDYEALLPIPADEKVRGFSYVSDPYGGQSANPIVSDVQDERTFEELETQGLGRRDAQHLAQAVSNGCDVFLTRDEASIIGPHRAWIEGRFPIKVRLPSELLPEL